MINQPPIDKLTEKAGCRYALVCGVSKRARQLIEQEAAGLGSGELSMGEMKAISLAAGEVHNGEIIIPKE